MVDFWLKMSYIGNKVYKTASHRHRVGAKPLWGGLKGCDDNVTEGEDLGSLKVRK